ncbi:MAG: hypothetical protein ACREEE_05615, partial [Dongiaceae bacterium]
MTDASIIAQYADLVRAAVAGDKSFAAVARLVTEASGRPVSKNAMVSWCRRNHVQHPPQPDRPDCRHVPRPKAASIRQARPGPPAVGQRGGDSGGCRAIANERGDPG